MKIAYCSDAHLEFGGRDFDLPDADVLILAGDICVASDLRDAFSGTLIGQNTRQFFQDVSTKYNRVIYVAGNHEHYGGCLDTTSDIINNYFKSEGISNIDHDPYGLAIIEDVVFIYATLWTDMNKRNPLITSRADIVSDYREITHGIGENNQFLTPKIVCDIHDSHKNVISTYAECHDKVVVVTHHAPHMMSSENKDDLTNYFYCCTDMEDIILDNPQISHYIHGHTHTNSDYMIGNTNVLSNCRGYKNFEKAANTFKIKVFEL